MILVLRALGIGDLATGVPALRGLRAAFPDAEIALAAPAWVGPLVALAGAVDTHVPVDGLGPHRWDLPARPSLAVNLHGKGPQSHRLLASAGAPRMWAWASPGYDGPQWRADEHEVARWCRLLAYHGVACDPEDLALRVPDPGDVPVGATIVHPGAKAPERRWPPERFAAVARALAGSGHRVVVTGSAAEHALASSVARLAGLPSAAVRTSGDVGSLAALVAHARLVVCGDTGIGHLATAYGVPSVLLFGPVSPALWGPPPSRGRHVALRAAPSPAPVPGVDPRLSAIGVDAVLSAVGRVLGETQDTVGITGRVGITTYRRAE